MVWKQEEAFISNFRLDAAKQELFTITLLIYYIIYIIIFKYLFSFGKKTYLFII